MGSALDVLNERIAELLYARIETPNRPEQLRTRTALGTRLRTFCGTESPENAPPEHTFAKGPRNTTRSRMRRWSMVALLA